MSKRGADEGGAGNAPKMSRDGDRLGDEDTGRLREFARQEYLKKREQQQLELAKRQLKDKEWLYKNIKLTPEQQKELEDARKAVSIAEQMLKEREEWGEVDSYKMPDVYDDEENKDGPSRFDVFKQRYKPEKKQVTDQELLESQKTRAAILKVGAQDKGKDVGEEFDFVLDEIEFQAEDELRGTHVKDEDAEERARAYYDMSRAERDKIKEESRMTQMERLQKDRRSLPIYKYRDDLLKAIRDFKVIIIVGETGSGKTTQVPQYLHEVGYTDSGIIGCTQPRRVAAMSVAARVATEMGVKLGHEVGYSIRFEECTGPSTCIKYMTDGMLLREFLKEPLLDSYSVMIVDEAHERSLHTDVLFGLVKDLSRYRDDFKLIISSATLNAEKFSEYFDNAPIFNVPGRRYPVSILYMKQPEANYIEAAIISVLQIHTSQPLDGDILVFLPGQMEIEEVEEGLKNRTKGMGTKIGELLILPIYANLPTENQAKIFEPTPKGARKVVLATNIAETSITIDNIVYVVDPGFVKQNAYSPKTGMESLIVVPTSKAAANQRTGRAGRVRPGKCFRLYTKWAYEKEMDDSNVPEIQRTNISAVVLMLKSLGIDDVLNFNFMDPPPPTTLAKALEGLYALGALNNEDSLTKLGRRMAEFPLEPKYAKVLIMSEKFKCVKEVLTIIAMLGVGNAVFYRPKDKQLHADNARKNFFRPGGDHLMLLNVYDQWEETGFSQPWCMENFVQNRSMKRARDVRDQLENLAERAEIDIVSCGNEGVEGIRKAFTAGFFANAAKLSRTGAYTTLKTPHTVDLHPQSSLVDVKPRVIVYDELVQTTKEYMRNCIEIKSEWLLEVAPHFYKASEVEPQGIGRQPRRLGASSSTQQT
mmetsp:Transcript_3318/g.6866  ORF Transcript_3318/g.6866 Transcript_3318/m.6866 type:complete len:873 (+) Transcript_3318:227-2845(+)